MKVFTFNSFSVRGRAEVYQIFNINNIITLEFVFYGGIEQHND